MKSNKINSTYNYCRSSELASMTRRIIDNMKDNTMFPNPSPALADVEKLLQEYVAALSNAGGRDRKLVAVKDDKQALLRQLLKELAQYVTQICNGDKTLLLSSGFDLNGQQTKPAATPPNLVVEAVVPGQATIRSRRITKARAYVHQYAADPLMPDSVWFSETTTKREHTITGLASGSRFWFQVIVITRKGEKIYWEPISRIIQ